MPGRAVGRSVDARVAGRRRRRVDVAPVRAVGRPPASGSAHVRLLVDVRRDARLLDREVPLNASVQSTIEPDGQLMACRVASRGGWVGTPRGDLNAGLPWLALDGRTSARWQDRADVRAFVFDRALAEEEARRLAGDDRFTLRAATTSPSPIDRDLAAHWERVFQHVAGSLFAPGLSLADDRGRARGATRCTPPSRRSPRPSAPRVERSISAPRRPAERPAGHRLHAAARARADHDRRRRRGVRDLVARTPVRLPPRPRPDAYRVPAHANGWRGRMPNCSRRRPPAWQRSRGAGASRAPRASPSTTATPTGGRRARRSTAAEDPPRRLHRPFVFRAPLSQGGPR